MEEIGDTDMMITLLIKAPDQQINDHIVECHRDWSVGRLKDHLEAVYPTKPKRSDQKIIFCGHILSDTLVLGDVLQQSFSPSCPKENTYTIHLVCSLKPMANTSSPSATATQETSSQVATNRHSNVVTPPSTVQQYYTQLNSQQMAWMQQAYTHYLTQYMHLMTAQGIQLQSTMPQGANSPRTEPLNNPNNQQNNVENEDRPAPAADVGEGNAGNNNAGDDVEGVVNRDWLDMFDMMARIMVLSSIVYFYSSPSRFLVVTFLGFAIYLIQGGFFRGPQMFHEVPRQENNNLENEQNQPHAQQAQPQEPGENQPRNNPSPVHPNESPQNRDVLRATLLNEENERPGAWAFTWTFLTSFFTSLIPEQAPVI